MDSPLDLDLDFDDTRMYIDHPGHLDSHALALSLLANKDSELAPLPFHPISTDFGSYSSSPSESDSSCAGSRQLSLSTDHSRQQSIDHPSEPHRSQDMSYVEQFVDDVLVSSTLSPSLRAKTAI